MEAELLEIAKYGSPHLFQTSTGEYWCCKVDMRFNMTGVVFEVKGKHATAQGAVTACLTNMRAAIKELTSVQGNLLENKHA